jgi:hypothetical protein
MGLYGRLIAVSGSSGGYRLEVTRVESKSVIFLWRLTMRGEGGVR